MKFKEIFIFGASSLPGFVTCFSFIFITLVRRVELKGGNGLYYGVCGVSFVYSMAHVAFMLMVLHKTGLYEKWTKNLLVINYVGKYTYRVYQR